MSELLVIGICGQARAGKDTIASHLVARHGFTRIALADGVRSLITDIDGPTWELRKQIESMGKTSRWAAQIAGTESRKAIANLPGFTTVDSHWIDHLLIKLEFLNNRLLPWRTRFVIPDIRFLAEPVRISAAVNLLGGRFVSWKVRRDGAGLGGEAGQHASEQEIELIPAHIGFSNNGEVEQLFRDVDFEIGNLS